MNSNIRKQLLLQSKEKGVSKRVAVPAEIEEEEDGDFTPQYHEKSETDQQRIRKVLLKSFLFKNLQPQQMQGVIDCMAKETVNASTLLIREGDPGDKFYVATSGSFEVVVGTFIGGVFDISTGKVVVELGPGTSFGELALMYNQPRSATIRTKTDAVVFSLDRRSFKKYLIQANQAQADVHYQVLQNVELFANLGETVLRQVCSKSLLTIFYFCFLKSFLCLLFCVHLLDFFQFPPYLVCFPTDC